MVERFNALEKRGNMDFEAWFNDRTESDRSWDINESDWKFRYRYIPTTTFFGKVMHWPLPIVNNKGINVLVSLYARPSFITGWVIARLKGVKTGFWVEVTFDSWVKRTALKELIKKWLFSRVDGIITVGDDGKKFSERYGASSDNIYFAPHVIDVEHYKGQSEAILPKLSQFREQIGLRGFTFIYVGRLWRGKGVNYLLDAFEKVQRVSQEEISLLLVGDGPAEGELKRWCEVKAVRNVVFAGFQQKKLLPQFYAMADVFVFPTLGDPYGLVVDEAMACSLPVISTSSAGEIKLRVVEEVNGFIVSPEDSGSLADRMLHLVRNPVLCAQMGEASLKMIEGRTPEKWAEDFESIVYSMLRK